MGCEGFRQRGLWVEPLWHLYLTGSLRDAALRARPDFRLTRGAQLGAASIRAAAKPSSGQNHLAGEPGAEQSVPEASAGDNCQSREPPHLAILREVGAAAGGGGACSTWVFLGHHPWFRPKILPLEIQAVCHGVVKSGPQRQADVGLSPGSAIHGPCDAELSTMDLLCHPPVWGSSQIINTKSLAQRLAPSKHSVNVRCRTGRGVRRSQF